MKWQSLCTDAINGRRMLRVQYDSFRNAPIMIEPHLFGMRSGVPTLWAWNRAQIDDYDWDHSWLWLEHDRVITADLTGGAFGVTRKGYDRRSRHFEQIFARIRSEEHTSELQSLMRISYAVFCF